MSNDGPSWLALFAGSLEKIGVGFVSLLMTAVAFSAEKGWWFLTEPFRWVGVLPRKEDS